MAKVAINPRIRSNFFRFMRSLYVRRRQDQAQRRGRAGGSLQHGRLGPTCHVGVEMHPLKTSVTLPSRAEDEKSGSDALKPAQGSAKTKCGNVAKVLVVM